MNPFPLVFYAYSSLFTVVICTGIAIFVLWKQPHFLAARLFSILTLSIAIWSWFYFRWLLITEDAAAADLAERLCMVPVMLMPPLFLHFSHALAGVRAKPGILLLNYFLGFVLAGLVFTPLFSPGVSPHLVFPFWLKPGPAFHFHVIHMLIAITCGLWILTSVAQKEAGQKRAQLYWTAGGFAFGWLSGFTNYLCWYRLPIAPVLNPLLSLWVVVIAYAIVRHQLMDIRVVIRRSLVYSGLIAAITVFYFLVVLVAERWFQGFFGYRSLVGTLLMAFVIAVFFNPLREWLQAVVDRALFAATPVELAAQREQLLAEVRKSDQMKAVGTLAAGLAHEIKNPLTSIKTFTEHLEDRYDDSAFRAKFRRIVGGEVDRINLIVQQLLEFAKPMPPKLKPLHVPNLIDDTLEFLGSELVEHRVEVKRDYQGHALILGDPQQLKQVFLNLLLNSLQAMNGNGRLTVQTLAQGSELTVTIADNGQGIDSANLPRIFEPFYTTKVTGTGLGLAVVRGIIHEHRGRIFLKSQVGQGTTVSIHLPLAT